MFSQCANPACRTAFNYREGTVFRLHRSLPAIAAFAANPKPKSVQHFWLCGCCARFYRLGYEDGRGVLLSPFPQDCVNGERPKLIWSLSEASL